MKKNKSQSPGPIYYIPWLLHIILHIKFKRESLFFVWDRSLLGLSLHSIILFRLSVRIIPNWKTVKTVGLRKMIFFFSFDPECRNSIKLYLCYFFTNLEPLQNCEHNDVDPEINEWEFAKGANQLGYITISCQLQEVAEIKAQKMFAESSPNWYFHLFKS